MSKCEAGDCSVECGGGKGCGCIALSDDPVECTCFCVGGMGSNGKSIVVSNGSTLVQVSINDLPFFEAAQFLDAVYKETIVVPLDKTSEQVSLNLKSIRFVEVLNKLGLTTKEAIERRNRWLGLLVFLVGFAIGALIFGLLV